MEPGIDFQNEHKKDMFKVVHNSSPWNNTLWMKKVDMDWKSDYIHSWKKNPPNTYIV